VEQAEYYHPTFDVDLFRRVLARLVRLLIRARWKSEPGFLSQQELAGWELAGIAGDRVPAGRLLMQAAETLAHLNRDCLPRCDPGGVQATSPATPLGRLVDAVSFLVNPEGGGPDHNGLLLTAARRLNEGATLNWDELLDWQLLPAIRADLDLLPQPQADFRERLEQIETRLDTLIRREKAKDWYEIGEFARLVHKAEITCREWCRLGRIRGEKKGSGRGRYQSWVVSHAELQRYQREGLLPRNQ
jgi:hypothetical protein